MQHSWHVPDSTGAVAVMALLPFAPLLLIQYSLKEALKQIMGILG